MISPDLQNNASCAKVQINDQDRFTRQLAFLDNSKAHCKPRSTEP